MNFSPCTKTNEISSIDLTSEETCLSERLFSFFNLIYNEID